MSPAQKNMLIYIVDNGSYPANIPDPRTVACMVREGYAVKTAGGGSEGRLLVPTAKGIAWVEHHLDVAEARAVRGMGLPLPTHLVEAYARTRSAIERARG